MLSIWTGQKFCCLVKSSEYNKNLIIAKLKAFGDDLSDI